MSPVVTEANVPDPRWRDEILQRVKRDPNIYLDIGNTYQSDPMICKATLLACEKVCFQRKTLEMVMSHSPHFDGYKAAFLQFVQFKDLEWMVKGYKEHFGSETGEDMEFLKRAIQRDGHAIIFKALPRAMRMDSELLQLAVENVCQNRVQRFLQAVPPEALAENESILLRAVGLHQDDVPHFFWQNREFIIKWLEANRSIASIPETVFSDREMCLLLYRRSLLRVNRTKQVSILLVGFQLLFALTRALYWNVWNGTRGFFNSVTRSFKRILTFLLWRRLRLFKRKCSLLLLLNCQQRQYHLSVLFPADYSHILSLRRSLPAPGRVARIRFCR
jgi:hypothetical protein